MVINKDSLFLFLMFASVFFLSYAISPFYVYGDQVIYRDVYEFSGKNSFIDALIYYRSRILSNELGHFVIIWLASSTFDKDIFISLSNALLAILSAKFLRNLGAHYIVVIVVVIGGYYFWAFFLSAERLKFSFLFLLAGLLALNSGKKHLSVFFFLVAAVTHIQSVLAISAFALSYYYPILKHAVFRLKVKIESIILMLFILAFMFSFLLFFKSHIENKMNAYNLSFGIEEYVRMAVFFILSILYCKKRYGVVIVVFIFWFFLVFLVGGMRINLFGYFTFILFAVQVKHGFNLGIVITTIYFLPRTVGYIFNTVSCGVNLC